MVAQAVVDSRKRFTNLFVGLPGSVNDMKMLRKSSLYRAAQIGGLKNMEADNCSDGIPSILLGDKGYPLLSWIVTPHKDDGLHRVADMQVEELMRRLALEAREDMDAGQNLESDRDVEMFDVDAYNARLDYNA